VILFILFQPGEAVHGANTCIFITSSTVMPALIPKPAPPDSLIISYLTLRRLNGLLGISLVPLLLVGSMLLDHTKEVQVSVSAYYYTSMRDELVGIICGISLFLLCYHGYSWKDSLVSKLAGAAALGIAFLPTSASNDKTDPVSILHYVSAAIFFGLLSYMSLFLFTKSAGHKTEQKKLRNRIYRTCGIIMLVSIVGVPIVNIESIHQRIGFLKPTLILETAALVSFGFSWLTKGEFLLKDN
jgi:hypothetical protein